VAELDEHARRIAGLVEAFERLPESEVREKVFELLENIDHLHRTCVWRLFELMTELGGKGLIDRLSSDPAVKTLFVLYDLIPSEPLQPLAGSAAVAAPHSAGFVPLRDIRVGPKPSWRVAFSRDDLPPGTLRAVEIDGVPVLLCSLEDEVFAYRNSCAGSVLPLHLGTLVEGEIHCPWHGCRYDARSGKQIGGTGLDLEAFPVSVEDGMIHVAAS
jgi:nitrite reductase/ring-hydroxylating ferredoxin subunit